MESTDHRFHRDRPQSERKLHCLADEIKPQIGPLGSYWRIEMECSDHDSHKDKLQSKRKLH
jgi:hypothetical protein